MFTEVAARAEAPSALAALQAAVARMCRLREELALRLDAQSQAARRARTRFPGALRIRGVVLDAAPAVAVRKEEEKS